MQRPKPIGRMSFGPEESGLQAVIDGKDINIPSLYCRRRVERSKIVAAGKCDENGGGGGGGWLGGRAIFLQKNIKI